jgi:hypothetical protein
MHASQRSGSVVVRHFLFLDASLQVGADPFHAIVQRVIVHVVHDDLEACERGNFRDAAAHRASPDDADGLTHPQHTSDNAEGKLDKMFCRFESSYRKRMEQDTALRAIQAILAPALGISAVGLLLLGLNARYSNIVNRIRLLNDERRRFNRIISDNIELSFTDNARYLSIRNQTQGLLARSKLVRNAILFLQLAIALFVITSVMIGLNFFLPTNSPNSITLLLFIGGMLCVLAGISNSALEVYRSHKIVLIDVNAEE